MLTEAQMEIANEIIEACAVARDYGFKIVCCSFSIDDCLCPISAVAMTNGMAKDADSAMQYVAKKYDLVEQGDGYFNKPIWSFIHGFDDGKFYYRYSDIQKYWFEIGEYVKGIVKPIEIWQR